MISECVLLLAELRQEGCFSGSAGGSKAFDDKLAQLAIDPSDMGLGPPFWRPARTAPDSPLAESGGDGGGSVGSMLFVRVLLGLLTEPGPVLRSLPEYCLSSLRPKVSQT